jgi:hypothetical protein
VLDEVELLDDDLVEIQTIPPEAASEPPAAEASEPPPPAAAKADFGLDFEEEEEPPASSRRPIASSMDQALSDAAEREVPLKTPPPESGPQEASIPPSPEVDELLNPGASEQAAIEEGIPTSAQLGNTVTLEEGGPADLEVETGSEDDGPSVEVTMHADELELPQREAAGTYDASLAPPSDAELELTRHRNEQAAREALNEELSEMPPIPRSTPPPAASQEEAGPQVFERPKVHVRGVTSIVGAAQRFQPKTFLELLDASLKLGEE